MFQIRTITIAGRYYIFKVTSNRKKTILKFEIPKKPKLIHFVLDLNTGKTIKKKNYFTKEHYKNMQKQRQKRKQKRRKKRQTNSNKLQDELGN